MEGEGVKLFISYSHRDETLREQLDKHLAPLKGRKVIEAWHDRQIQAGMNWADKIDDNLNQADIILLLVSPDFVASNYCFNIELKQAMKRHENGEAIVVPVILEPCDWSWLPFSKLQAFPKDAKAITTWENKNEAFLDVAKGIRKVAQDLFEQRQQKLEQKKAAREQYLKKVEEALSDGKISLAAGHTLEELREVLKLTREEAEEIETHAFEPWKKYEQNLRRYEKTVREYIQYEYPFSDETKKELKLRQRDLGIKTEDVEKISQPILAEAEAKYQEELKKEEAERQQQQKPEKLKQLELKKQPEQEDVVKISQPILAKAEAKYQEKLKKEEAEKSLSSISLQVFEFDVVTLDVSGRKVKPDKSKAEYFTEDLGNGVTLDMVAIPGGKFLMGSPKEFFTVPQHFVTVPPFFIGKYQVTQKQWRVIAKQPKLERELNPDPSHFKGDNRPVESISWYDAVEFCARLSRKTGREYQLPSEAQWEYACRAGTTTPFHFGETITHEVVNCKRNLAMSIIGLFVGETTEVGSFEIANAFGLYDMHGNVSELCADHWHKNYKGAPTDGSAWLSENKNQSHLVRGGSWDYDAGKCRSASRLRDNRVLGGRFIGNSFIGFRVGLNIG